LETLRWLKRETKVWFEITNLMIPDLNDDPAETRRLAEWILRELGADVPLHFTAFHPDFKLKDRGRTPAATLDRAREIAREVGLRYVYEGNIFTEAANTFCPGCGVVLVRRSWHDVVENRIVEGNCCECGFAIAGRWERGGVVREMKGEERLKRYEHLNL
jgi:pyruvate formate lyase activating enzyme